MDDNILSTMKGTIKKAEGLLNKIKTIDNILDNVRIAGKIENFEISYPTISKGGFGYEPGDPTTGYMKIDAKLLGMTQLEYSEMYKELIIGTLEKMKKEYQKQYKELK